MYVYRTSVFDQRVSKHQQLWFKVERLCQEFETMDLETLYTRFKVLHSYLKRKEGNFRLIGKIFIFGEDSVLCLLKVFSRGEPAYTRFLEESKRDSHLFQKLELESEIEQWLQKKQQKTVINQSSLATLPQELRFCLERPNWKFEDDDIVVHESETWCYRFSEDIVRSQAKYFRQLIENLVNDFDFIGTVTHYEQIKYYGENNHYIIFSSLVTQDQISQRVLLLIAPLLEEPTTEIIQEVIELAKVQEGEFNWWRNQKQLTLEDLIIYTRRSYPGYILLEEAFWLKIQSGDRVNLALSQEEKELLHSVSTDKSLPLFLNGRAGSGKSTMLFYLFAYYCYRHLQFCQERKQDFWASPHPLFLTYSKNLSDYAKERVQSLLRYHYHFVEETSRLERIPNLGSYFQSFRTFLIKLLPAAEKNNFPEDKHISFHWFRQQCDSRSPGLSPEKCWLVIQNFIKGYSLKDENIYLEDELEYAQIPKKEQKVSVEEFIEIRDRVWSWYYKYTQDNFLWDDRDLIRVILGRHYYKSQYTVIFCDEAQDFTRLELQLIMRLSVFPHYNLAQETILSLPFAFAGDPLQTLNPTGFRWAGFKAAFHDEILSALTKSKNTYLTIELKQLNYNYRSVGSIVKVNNLIQLWRKLFCGFTSLEPQEAKKESDFIPEKFIIKENAISESLLEIIKDSIILIPCDEGEEREFIKQDTLLQQLLFSSENSQVVPWNILSAITAKGLEFKQVILYKFGQRCPVNFAEEQQEITEEIKYFLNKLYVAASRPTERLFIIDTTLGETNLWHYASDRVFLETSLELITNQEERIKWENNIQLIHQGTSFQQIKNNDLEANALTFETVGINTENIDFLIRAIAAYQQSQNSHKTDFCTAWKLRLERAFIEAGNLFYQLQYMTEAAECFWQGLAWNKLLKILPIKTDIDSQDTRLLRLNLLSPLVQLMAQVSDSNNSLMAHSIKDILINLTNFLNTEVQEQLLTEEYDSKPWQTTLNVYQQCISQISQKSAIFSPENWLEISHTLSNWFDKNNSEIILLTAKCWYLGQDYHQAVQTWENWQQSPQNLPKEDITYYYLAKAKVTTLPMGLEYLAIAKEYHIIINQWIKAGKNLDPSWLKYVALALARTDNIEQAFIIYCYLDEPTQVQQCWQKITQNSFSVKYLHKILQYYLEQEYWTDAICLAETYLTVKDIPYYFLYQLAYSKLLPDKLSVAERQRYQQFLNQVLVLKDIKWQQYLSIIHLGIILEKIGSINPILSFYQQYTNSNNEKLRNFIRDRWLATKQKQVEYFQSVNNVTQAQKTQQELTIQAKQWNLTIESISLTIPEITKKKTQPLPTSSPNPQSVTASLQIQGLQNNIPLQTIAYGIQQFQVHHLIIRVMLTTKQISIIDLLSNKTLHLDSSCGKIQIDTTIIVASDKQPLSFKDSQGYYQGTLWCNPHPRLEINLDSYSEKISLEFSNL